MEPNDMLEQMQQERDDAMVLARSLMMLLLGYEYITNNPKEHWLAKTIELYRNFGANIIEKIIELHEQRDAVEQVLYQIREYRMKQLGDTCPDCSMGCSHGAEFCDIIKMVNSAIVTSRGW